MGYYDAIENAWFKKREDGKYIFFPHGVFGYGYILTEEESSKVKDFVGAYTAIGLFIAIACASIFLKYLFLAPLIIGLEILVYEIKIKGFLKDKEKSMEKMKSSEAIKNMASKMSMLTLITFMVSEIVIFGFIIFMIIVVLETAIERLLVLLFGLLLIFCFRLSIRMISHKIKTK